MHPDETPFPEDIRFLLHDLLQKAFAEYLLFAPLDTVDNCYGRAAQALEQALADNDPEARAYWEERIGLIEDQCCDREYGVDLPASEIQVAIRNCLGFLLAHAALAQTINSTPSPLPGIQQLRVSAMQYLQTPQGKAEVKTLWIGFLISNDLKVNRKTFRKYVGAALQILESDPIANQNP